MYSNKIQKQYNKLQKQYNKIEKQMDPIEIAIFDAEYQLFIDKLKLEKAQTECEILAIKENMIIQERILKESIMNKRIREIEQDFE